MAHLTKDWKPVEVPGGLGLVVAFTLLGLLPFVSRTLGGTGEEFWWHLCTNKSLCSSQQCLESPREIGASAVLTEVNPRDMDPRGQCKVHCSWDICSGAVGFGNFAGRLGTKGEAHSKSKGRMTSTTEEWQGRMCTLCNFWFLKVNESFWNHISFIQWTCVKYHLYAKQRAWNWS